MRGKRRSVSRAWAMLIVPTLVAVGCSSDDSGDDTTAAPTTVADSGTTTPGPDASSTAPDSTDGSTDPTSGSTPTAGTGDIKVQLYLQPTTLSPLVPPTGGIGLLDQLHYDALVGIDDNNEVIGRLAESFESSADAKTWTFHLRPDVKWSDGEAFDAEDVVASLEAYANPATGSWLVSTMGQVAGAAEFVDGTATDISGVTSPDPLTVDIELVEPNAAFPVTLAEPLIYMMPEHVLSTMPAEGLSENPYWREPTTGVGPYVFSRWVSDDEVELVANPEYRTPLGAARVYAQFLSSEASLAQLEAGEIDFAQVSSTDASRVADMDGVVLHTTDGAGVMAFHTAWEQGKLADARVRQAFLYAIDRQAIVDELLNGEGKVVSTLIHGPEWAMPDGLNDYAYDPDEARRLLAEAGWDSSTEVRLEFSPSQADRERLATIAAAQLQEVGINAVPTPYEAAVLSEHIANRDFDALLSSYGLFNVDPATMNPRLLCSQAAPAGANLSAYCNPELDELLLAAVATADQAERQAIYAQAQQIVNEEVPVLVMYVPNTLAGTSERLSGFKLNSLATQAFWNAAEWSAAG